MGLWFGKTNHSDLSGSERLQERQQAVGGVESTERRIDRHDFFERLFLHSKTRMHVGVGGFYAFVTQPESNHGDIHAGLKQGHCGAMANHMRGNSLSPQTWAMRDRSLDCFAKQEVNGKPRKWLAPNVREHQSVLIPSDFPEPLLDRLRGPGPKRNRPLLTALPAQVHIALRTETDLVLPK